LLSLNIKFLLSKNNKYIKYFANGFEFFESIRPIFFEDYELVISDRDDDCYSYMPKLSLNIIFIMISTIIVILAIQIWKLIKK
jgi:hypothetical protein